MSAAACIALVREAVAVRRAHAAAIAMSAEERHAHPETWRLPELDYEDWYARAEAAVAALDAEASADGYVVWYAIGAADWAARNGQALRPPFGTSEEAAYLDGWRAAVMDDLAARCAELPR